MALKVAHCMTPMNESWAKHLSDADHSKLIVADVSINGVGTICGGGFSTLWAGANTGATGNSCTAPGDSCSPSVFQALMNSPLHKANILSSIAQYVAVGTYRDSLGRFYVSQTFMYCGNCQLSWTLSGSTTVSSATQARANSITVPAGVATKVTFYQNVKNSGPDPATFGEHVNSYHYSGGKLVFSANNLDVGTPTIGSGVVRVLTDTITIPATAPTGDQYCRLTYYQNATGRSTDPGTTNKACATVR